MPNSFFVQDKAEGHPLKPRDGLNMRQGLRLRPDPLPPRAGHRSDADTNMHHCSAKSMMGPVDLSTQNVFFGTGV